MLKTGSDVRGVKRLNQEFEKTDKQLDEITKGFKGTAGQARKLAEQAEPMKRLDRQMATLAKHVKAGRLSLADAEKLAGKYQRQLDRTAESGNKAHGRSMIGNLGAMAAGYLSINAALSTGIDLLKEQARLVDEAAKRDQASRAGVAPLAQLAATSATTPEGRRKKFREFEAEARQFFASGGASTYEQSGLDVFDLVSAGLNRKDRNFARDVQASGALQNVAGAATAYASLQATLGANAPKTFEDFLDQAIAASAIAPAQANEIPLAASRSAGSASALGLGPEFLNAATAYLAKSTGSASQGGTQLAAFLKGIESKGLEADPSLKGKSGVGLLTALAGRNLDRGGLANLLGNDNEAITGARTLINVLPQLQQSVGAIRTADAENLAAQTLGLPDASPGLKAARLATTARQSAEINEQNHSARLQNLLQAAFDERRANRAAGTEGEWGDYLQDNLIGNLSVLIGGDYARRTELSRVLNHSSADVGANPLSDALAAEIATALGKQTGVLEQIRDGGSAGRQE